MSGLVDEIVAMFEEEQRVPQTVHRADEVPLSYDAITAEWLTAILCREAPGVKVTDFSFGPADDGSSNRRRIFLSYNAEGDAAGLPRTVFCKATMSLGSRLILGLPGTALGETNFYNKIRPRLAIEAPEALHAAYDEKRFAYIVVLKDIGDRVHFCDHNVAIDHARAEAQALLLADFHGPYYSNPDLGRDAAPFKSWSDFWDEMMINAPYFAGACDEGFAAAAKVMPPEIAARRSDVWAYTQRSVDAHRTLPHTLLHCDTHLRNWYITQDGRMGLTDWQIVTTGHWSRDFIYAMTSSLAIEDRRAWLPDLLRLYLDRMEQHGVPPIPFDTALKLCRQQLFSALAFWTVTLRPAEGMPDMQPEDACLLFIERMSHAMADLDAFSAFDED